MKTEPDRRGTGRQAWAQRPRLVAIVAMLLLGACSSGNASKIPSQQTPANATPDQSAKVALDIADQQRAKGDYNGAVSFYRRALEIEPKSVRAMVGLGEALLAGGSADGAADAFRKALDRAPHDPVALGGLGASLVALDQAAPAVDLLRKGLPSAPSARGYRSLVVAEDLLGQYPAAIEDARRGLALAPEDLGLKDDLGLSQALAGDLDGAIATMRAAASSSGAGPRHRQNLALVLGLAGRIDEARQAASTDLDARAVDANLAFYAQLRSMTAQERAEALLRPAGSRVPSAPLPRAG